MAHGGARPRSGPAPDPTALRRDRSSDAEQWITLPAVRSGPIPDWPLMTAPSETETAYWERLWRSPQSTQWEKHGAFLEVAMYVRNLSEAELPGAPTNLRTETRRMAEHLGLSMDSMLKNRWQIEGQEVLPTKTATVTSIAPDAARPTSRGKSSRDRFRQVKRTEGL